MSTALTALVSAATVALGMVATGASAAPVKSIVLVHGGFVDGSGWEGVYEILKRDGYDVTIVQNATATLADDVATTKRAIASARGNVILVGHSYGGVAPYQWLARRCVFRAKDMLRGTASLAHIALASGFADQSHLTRTFSRHVGLTPGKWRSTLH